MAANAGKIFVQVELDDKKFKTSLANMPSDAKATASGIETVWRTLGTQSEAAFNAQRTAYKNALTLIKNDVNSTKADIVRAEEAAAAKIKGIDTQQFGERTSMLSTFKSHYIAITASIAVAVGAISKAWDLAKAGADYKEQEGILNNLARKYSTTSDEIVDAMEAASDGLVSRADLMSVALGGLAKGLDPSQLTDLADAARLLGDTVGMNATESLKQLTTALETGRTKGLKMFMGSAIDLESTMGDLYSKMTETEKTQALYNITMIEAAKLQAQQTGEVSDAADQIERLEAKWANVKTTVSIFAMETMVGLFDAFAYLGKTVTEQDEIIDDFGQSVDVAALSTETLASKIWKWVVPAFNAWMESEEEAEKRILATMNQTDSANKSLASHTDNINEETDAQKALIAPYQATIDKLKQQVAGREDNKKAIEDEAKAAKNAAKEAADAAKAQGAAYVKMCEDEEKAADAFYEKLVTQRDADAKHAGDVAAANYKTITDADAKLLAAKEADSTAYKKLITGEADFAETENERAINKIIADHGAKMTALNTLQENGNLTYQQYVDAKALIDKNYNAALVNQAETARDKVNNASYSIYKTGTGYGKEAYEFAVAQIAAQAKKYEEMGVSVTAVQKYIKDANNEAYIAMLKDSSDWKDGVVAYFKEAATQAKTSATYMYDVMKTFADSSKTAISTTLFDAIKTGTVDMQTVWNTFADTMLKKLTDTVASMAVEWAQNGIAKMIASADTLWVETSTGLLELASESKTTFGGMATEFGGAILNMISAAGQEISMTFTAVWDAASAAVIAGIKALQKFFAYEGGYVRESGIGAYAGGGQVQGYASGGDSKSNDTVLAWLSPGEYVMPRSAVNPQTIPHLEYMREHKEPRGYAYGGIIPHDDQLPGLSAPYQGSLKWYDDDEWEALTDPYRMLHDHYGLTYYNGKWGKLGFSEDDYGPYPSSFSEVSDPITYTGQIINAENGYQLQDENNPPQALDTKDYEYLLNWYGSSIGAVPNTGWGDCIYDQWAAEHGMNATTGAVDPNHIWVEEENGGYRWYMRDGSDYWVDPSESNWLKRFMPGIIKGLGAVAAIVIASAAALPTGGQSFTALAGIMAAIEGGMASLPALYAAGAAGLYSAFCTYGETGSLTGALIAGIISAASTAISFGSGTSTNWIDNGSGLMVLQSEMPQAGYLTAAQGRVIADVIRKGGGEVLQQTLLDVFGGGGSMAISKSGTSGGLGDLESQYYGLPDLMSGAVSLRSGLDYVPYDNFPARLHEGERVLTKEENKASGRAPVFHIYLDGEEIKGRMRIIADKVFVDRASSGIGSMQRVYA